jgi:hypothetical protein
MTIDIELIEQWTIHQQSNSLLSTTTSTTSTSTTTDASLPAVLE